MIGIHKYWSYVQYKKGGDILSHRVAVPSALIGLTSLFGMGRGEPYRYNHLKLSGEPLWLFYPSPKGAGIYPNLTRGADHLKFLLFVVWFLLLENQQLQTSNYQLYSFAVLYKLTYWDK